MLKRLIALSVIFIFTTIAWFILGGITMSRSTARTSSMKTDVEQLWGSRIDQRAPEAYHVITERRLTETNDNGKTVKEYKDYDVKIFQDLSGTTINAKMKSDYRKRGLIWYSTFTIEFSAAYVVTNTTGQRQDLLFDFFFPNAKGSYDKFVFSVNGIAIERPENINGTITARLDLKPGESAEVSVGYVTHGMDSWSYAFNQNVEQRRNVAISVETDFQKVDYPEGTLSPTTPAKTKTDGTGYIVQWNYESLMSNQDIGIEMPKKINPGDFVSTITFFAPVSLFFFFFLMFIITTIKKINLHPMHYFFLSAAFFSFHLLMAYLADHIELKAAFIISTAVSLFLVISYLRLVVGKRFAFVEAGIAQFVYLVVFSYAFFLEGFTGLTITVLSIITLFVVMQATAKIDWENQWRSEKLK